MTDFKTDIEKAADEYGVFVAMPIIRSMMPSVSRSTYAKALAEAYREGAQWARERGFMEAVEMLRSAGMHAAIDYLEWKRKEISK